MQFHVQTQGHTFDLSK